MPNAMQSQPLKLLDEVRKGLRLYHHSIHKVARACRVPWTISAFDVHPCLSADGETCAPSFDDKLDGRGLDRVSVACLPDTGLYGMAAAYQGPEKLMRVPCRGAHEVTVHQPVNAYYRHVFGYSKGKGLKRIRNTGVHGELQARGGAHQTQGGGGGGGTGGSRGAWLMQRAEMLGSCPRDKPLTHGWALGTGALASQTADGYRSELRAVGERLGIKGAMEVSEKGAQD